MSQTSWQKQQQPLDTLQSMINAVLIETGRALRSANRKGAKTIGHTHDRLQAFLPNAVDKFHLALDELESDIMRAKAVLSRDLQELRARQYQLEHPNAPQVEDAMDLAIGSDVPEAPLLQNLELISSEPLSEVKEIVKSEDSVNSPRPKLESPPSTLLPAQTTQVEPQLLSSLEDSIPQVNTTDDQAKDDSSKVESEAANPETAQGLGISTTDTAPSANSEAPLDSDLQTSASEPMFDSNNNGDADLNFDDFDFAVGSTGDQNQDFSGNEGGFDLSSFGNPVTNDNGESASMLPGLDTYGDGSADDFAMVDVSNNTTGNQDGGENSGVDFGMSGGDLDMALGMGASESTFNDLFDGLDFEDGGNNGTGGNIMEHGEFDKVFFGLDSD